MKSIKILIVILLFIVKSFAQSTKIETNRGIHYITNDIKYTITGTYTFNGTEPIVELNDGGVGFYQLHEQPKRAIISGMECNEAGEPMFTKGFDNAAYTLWYQYITKLDSDNETNWTSVEFTIHFNTLKMFIKGERSKNYIEPRE
jgi:hypothetical protein